MFNFIKLSHSLSKRDFISFHSSTARGKEREKTEELLQILRRRNDGSCQTLEIPSSRQLLVFSKMEGRQTNCPPCSSNESGVLDVKPLRSLSPMFPAPFGLNMFSVPGPRPFVCVSPFGGGGTGTESAYTCNFSPMFPNSTPPASPNFRPTDPILRPTKNGAKHVAEASQMQAGPVPRPTNNGATHVGEASNFNSPVRPTLASPSFQTPATMIIPLDEDDSAVQGEHTSSSGRKIKRPVHLSSYSTGATDTEGSGGKKVAVKRKQRPKKADDHNLGLRRCSSQEDPRQSVEVVLMTFDALRRRVLQLDEASNVNRRPDLKASAILMGNDLRANMGKRIGPVPGIEVGDIFYFRIEMCLVGLHAPPMAGIDYMTARFDDGEDPIALSIVSAGGYANEEDDVDVLIYIGQGGGGGDKNDPKQMGDQKLERGNLALEKSLCRGNQIRVIRSAKDSNIINGKIYVYDGLYKIQVSWVDKAKSGFNVFKYKLLREPGQPPGIAVWKITQKWIENPSSRGKVILSDISSGIENVPVCLVNELDDEKGPSHFTYATTVKYSVPISSMNSLHSCKCLDVCLPGDANCSGARVNGGNLPYSSTGFLVSRKHLIHECNASCQCSVNCRNRVTQKGIKLHFEVFRTGDRGWGLRSWDPIRAGSFICEYTGEVIHKIKVNDDGEEDEYIFQTTYAGEKALKWNYGPELLGEPNSDDSSEAPKTFPFIISAKSMGNISRFMNHNCSPNAFWQPILHDHADDEYPHIMFFAIKHIPPMTELTYDYGLSGAESGGGYGPRSVKKCLCGSSNCRGLFG